MTDLTTTIAPKSDQLNADDLIGRTMTIRVTDVRLLGEADQPVAIHFEGDNGKPYKPCKSMRRVMVHVWGGDGKRYAGRRMTLYRDEGVVFGGAKVGGIRISHMSDIDRDVSLALTVTRASRKPYTVKPLRSPANEERRTFRADDRQPERQPQPRDDDFPGDRDRAPATEREGGGFGASPPPQDREEHEAVTWARGVQDDLEAGVFETARSIDEFTSDPANHERFQELNAADPALAARLNAQLRGKHKALIDRERSR